jgi:hypothetical protein
MYSGCHRTNCALQLLVTNKAHVTRSNFSPSTSTQISSLHSGTPHTHIVTHKQHTSDQKYVTELFTVLHTPAEPLFVLIIYVQAAVGIVPRPLTNLNDQPKYRTYKTTYSLTC